MDEYLKVLNTEQGEQLAEIISYSRVYGNKPPQYIREERKVGRNEKCYCGSGNKYKKCCINKTK